MSDTGATIAALIQMVFLLGLIVVMVWACVGIHRATVEIKAHTERMNRRLTVPPSVHDG